ncbi:inhibin beta chain-like [Schistocerca americana]|uniref:inhibin beta chain-like n=1 Tax=Schistocerca americana TaxID=7009 RepID=UPI001F4F6B51|nr:inhibin beta chain-like [Schistocerca americana]
MADELDSSFYEVQSILTKDLNIKRVSTKFIAKVLLSDQRQYRLEVSQELVTRTKNDPDLLNRESLSKASIPDQKLPTKKEETSICHTLNGQTLLEFSRFQEMEGQGAGPELRVKAAALWVRVAFRPSLPKDLRSIPDKNLTLWLFKVTKPATVSFTNDTHLSGKEFDDYTEMAASLPVTLSGLGWLKFDLTSTVQNWYAARHAPRERLRLLVDCSGCSYMVEAILSLGLSNDAQRPFLVVHTDPTAIRRVRRRALDCTDGDKGPCCKNKFYVNFTEIGWEDWIIAPSGYYANYCRGDCGGPHRTPDSYVNFHTPPLEEYRKMDSLPGLQPCCAPLKFSSMSLIYWGLDNKIIKRDLPKMVVDECGCP